MTDTCLVLLTNNSYFDKMLYTLSGITQAGYNGDICVVIGDDLQNSEKLKHHLLQTHNIAIKYFPDIIFSNDFLEKFNSMERDEYWRVKKFQYHKLHLFNTFFKQWKYIFYVDSGITVLNSIDPILQIKKQKKLLAHSDAYPEYTRRLEAQFVFNEPLFSKLREKYNLDIDYPQTTIMLYDTDIIENDTYTNLLQLAEDVKISMTNDQGIIALYFTCIHNVWEQIQLEDEHTWFYDYAVRPFKRNKPHILVKCL
jgi:hypothetical protein